MKKANDYKITNVMCCLMRNSRACEMAGVCGCLRTP